MLVRVERTKKVNPSDLADRFVRGGLWYVRPGRVDFHAGRVEYQRTTREVLPLRGRPWRNPRVRRVSHLTVRLLRANTPPALVSQRGAVRPRSWSLEGLAPLVGDPLESRVRHWRYRFGGSSRPRGTTLGVPEVGVYLRHRSGWSPRGAPSRGGYSSFPSWGSKPRKHQDPLLFRREWSRRGGWSPLGGSRRVLEDSANARVDGLVRRVRFHRWGLLRLDRLGRYREGLFGRTRRKLKLPQRRRWFLFRRRRLRGGVYDRVGPQNYFQGVTRRFFRRAKPNRSVWFEGTPLWGNHPYEGLSRWTTWMFGTRVATPLEYNRVRSVAGFPRLIKRRRLGARPWKLGQHPEWGPPYRAGRAFRWGWFFSTPLGDYLQRLRTASWGDPAAPPLGRGFLAGTYWSIQKWGRSRWKTRPTHRAVSVFLNSLKRGTSVEHDATQWGGASTSATGVLYSLGVEHHLRPQVSPHRRPRRGRQWGRRWGRRLGWGLGRLRVGWLRLRGWGWRFLFGPLWWGYHGVARGWCFLFWGVRVVWFALVGVTKALGIFGGDFFLTRGVRPFTRWVTHRVKETRFSKALGWAYTSWLLLSVAEDDQAVVETPRAAPPEENNEPYFQEELNPTGEQHPSFDQLGEGFHIQVHARSPRWVTWFGEPDDDLHEINDEFFFFVREELPYRVGFFFQPLLDGLVKLPWWGFLEGTTLFVLAFKLELQRGWKNLLLRGGPRRGRWWKIPAVLLVRAGGWVFFAGAVWVVGTQLSYSTLRVEWTYTVGLPWREEYYLAWWGLCTLGVAAVVGPRGIKNLLFGRVGWSNLLGFFVGVTEAASPEEYHPGRPAGVVSTLVHQTMAKDRMRATWRFNRGDLQEDSFRSVYWVNLDRSEEARLLLFLDYYYRDGLYPEEFDSVAYGFFPIHLDKAEDRELWPTGVFAEPVGADRSLREPHLRRNNRYELPWGTEDEWSGPVMPHWQHPSPRDRQLYFSGSPSE